MNRTPDKVTTSFTYLLGIVFYNPAQEEIARANRYAQSGLFKKVVVYDNSAVSCQDKLLPDIDYVQPGKNNGLSVAYNKMLDYATTQRFDFLCLLDQDSNFPMEEIQKMMRAIEKHAAKFTHTAVLAPRVYTHRTLGQATPPRDQFTREPDVMNAGSFLNMDCVRHYGLRYDESVFLDGVDYDFCWSAYQKGCDVQVYHGASFLQNLGYQSSKYPTFCAHSALRYYYMARNRKYVYRKHKGFWVGTYKSYRRNLSTLYRIVRYEDARLDKAWALLKGWLGGRYE